MTCCCAEQGGENRIMANWIHFVEAFKNAIWQITFAIVT